MSTTKITLKSGYTSGYLPEGVGYKNYTILVALANYSTNGSVAGNAAYLLADDISLEDKTNRLRHAGGFFTKACTQDFAAAWNHADGSNRAALIEGLTKNEIEL